MSLKKILLFILLIPSLIFSQSVTKSDDLICFDTITASKIMNDLKYCDSINLYVKDLQQELNLKVDTVNECKYQLSNYQKVTNKQESVLFNKQKIDFIQYTTIVILTIITYFVSN